MFQWSPVIKPYTYSLKIAAPSLPEQMNDKDNQTINRNIAIITSFVMSVNTKKPP
jgi:hypothetical protein